MKAEKTVLFSLDKCYALAKLTYRQEECFLVGEEKHAPSYLFHGDGRVIGPVFEAPGGVMTMEPLPGTDGEFLCTQEFYSPNDGKQARIVWCRPQGEGWEVRTLVEIPMVHRFGILSRNGVRYLLVCTIKNDYTSRDDWRQPGAVYAAVLPEDLSAFHQDDPLRLYPIAAGLWKNHGFAKYMDDGVETALVGSQEGLFQFLPPQEPGGAWEIRQLLTDPCSDAVMADFDGDGLPEIGSITPFHGDALRIYKQDASGCYQPVWEMPYPMEMLHATFLGSRKGKPVWFTGCRKGVRQTLALYWSDGAYRADVLDDDAGAANALQLDEDTLVCTNYTTGQVVLYRLSD